MLGLGWFRFFLIKGTKTLNLSLSLSSPFEDGYDDWSCTGHLVTMRKHKKGRKMKVVGIAKQRDRKSSCLGCHY